MRRLPALLCALALTLTACGGGAAPVRSSSVRQVLMANPEFLEFESVSARQELFRDLARISNSEAGSPNGLVLFPIIHDGQVIAAPALEARTDLLQAPDAGAGLQLSFEARIGERWPEDRRESLQGLSEREAAELVARSLLLRWGLSSASEIRVDRASGAPYAVAYADGILRINPSFIYLAAAASSPTSN